MKEKLLSIGEFSKLTDIHIKSLHYYDRIGVLKPAYVDPKTGYRYYNYIQLNTIDAVRACIELDIPLNSFSDFVEDGGSKIHYAKLMEHGKILAQKKMDSIREKLLGIEYAQQEMIRCDKLLQQRTGFPQNIQEKSYLIIPIKGSDEFIENISKLIALTIERNYKTGWEMGLLYLFHPHSTEKYACIEIISPIAESNLLKLPAGQYTSKCVDESRIEYTREEFPDMFQKEETVIALESEILSADYNPEKPLYELRCGTCRRNVS